MKEKKARLLFADGERFSLAISSLQNEQQQLHPHTTLATREISQDNMQINGNTISAAVQSGLVVVVVSRRLPYSPAIQLLLLLLQYQHR